MKAKFLWIIVLIITAGLAEEPPPEITAVAKEELKGEHLFFSFESGKKYWGFKPSTKLSDVKVGAPVQILRINWKLLKSAADSASVSAITDTTDSWYVPLMEEGEFVTFLTVAKTDGKWKAVGGGGTGFCCGWKKVLKCWPMSKYHMKIIGVGIHLYFNVIEKGDYNLTKFIPFPCPDEIPHNKTYIKNNPVPDYKKLTPSSDVIKSLRKR
jgi:hypothetical protein